jgi:hypothetical protein
MVQKANKKIKKGPPKDPRGKHAIILRRFII